LKKRRVAGDGVGVRTERTIELKRIDLDYFEETGD
jgi:restriction endonuclease Mrr